MLTRIMMSCLLFGCLLSAATLGTFNNISGNDPGLYTVSGTAEGLVDTRMSGVSILLVSSSTVFETRSNSAGAFRVSNVPPGSYELQAIAPDTKRTIMQVQVKSKSVEDVAVTLSFAYCERPLPQALPTYQVLNGTSEATFGGIVRRSRNKPLSGVEINLVNPITREQLHSRSSSQGKFLFRGLSPGRYTLTATRKPYLPIVLSNLWAVAGHSGHMALLMEQPGAVCE